MISTYLSNILREMLQQHMYLLVCNNWKKLLYYPELHTCIIRSNELWGLFHIMLSFKHSCLWRTKNTTYYIVMILSNLKLWWLRIKMLYLIHVLTVSNSCPLRDRTKYQMTIYKLSLVNRIVWVTNFCFSFSGLIA